MFAVNIAKAQAVACNAKHKELLGSMFHGTTNSTTARYCSVGDSEALADKHHKLQLK